MKHPVNPNTATRAELENLSALLEAVHPRFKVLARQVQLGHPAFIRQANKQLEVFCFRMRSYKPVPLWYRVVSLVLDFLALVLKPFKKTK